MVICNASVFFSDHSPVGLMLVALLVFLHYSYLTGIGMDSLGRSSHGFLFIFLSLVACVSVDNVPLVCRFTSLKLIAYSLVLYPFFYFRHDMNRMHLLSVKLLSSYLLHPWQFANVNHANPTSYKSLNYNTSSYPIQFAGGNNWSYLVFVNKFLCTQYCTMLLLFSF